jgi:hypothetical protein
VKEEETEPCVETPTEDSSIEPPVVLSKVTPGSPIVVEPTEELEEGILKRAFPKRPQRSRGRRRSACSM